MAGTHILRLPRTDEEKSFVLVQVTSTGSMPLDTKLIATEGDFPYAVKLRHDRVSTLKDKKIPCSEDEWETILADVLLDRRPDPDIEAVAHVSEQQSITITVRRSISGIKQRLGTLSLKCNENEAIELFQWCGTSIAAKEQIKAELASVASKGQELESAVNQLKNQLEELIQAKQADESELLEKFRDLLNEKKVKIREQQRLLAAINTDPSRNPTTQTRYKTPEDSKGHVPEPSRTIKRRASESAVEEESDDGFERMEVDKKREEDSEMDRTTDTDDDETGSEPDDASAGAGAGDGDDDDDEEPIAARKHVARRQGKAPLAPLLKTTQKKQAPPPEAPPPPRALPFISAKSAPVPPHVEGSETESDDEL